MNQRYTVADLEQLLGAVIGDYSLLSATVQPLAPCVGMGAILLIQRFRS
ncbi:MAG: hypothetical protein ACAF41_15590 [Leptolyngbya sp. BL-A-14]